MATGSNTFSRNVAMVRIRIGLTLLAAMGFLKRCTPGSAWLLAPLALLILVVPALAAVGNNSTVAGNGAGGFSGDGGLATSARQQSCRGLNTAPTVNRSGDVAVIEDDGTLSIPANDIDLAGHGIDFKRRKDGLRATIKSSVSIKKSLGSKLDMGLSTSIFVEFPARFEFPFFGNNYDGVYVNTDGNLTFTQPDTVSLDTNSVARVLTGPPRIAPLFFKLDPSKAEGTAGIYSKLTAKSLQITWLRVPQWGSLRDRTNILGFPVRSNENTFQVTLFKNGRILIAYGELALLDSNSGSNNLLHRSAVVGVAPGGGSELQLLDFTADLPVATTTGALLERFSQFRILDDQAIAQAFYSRFADVYDQLIVWLDFPFAGGFFFPAYALMPSNAVQGIGRDRHDLSAAYGSDGNLRSYAQMGTLANYSLDPAESVTGFITSNTWDVVAHAVGHRWLSYVRFRDAEGNASNLLRRVDDDPLSAGIGPAAMSVESHWNSPTVVQVGTGVPVFLDSDASVMGGYDLRDNGNGFFTTIATTDRYSRLDRYLMGLIPAQQVGDISLVTVVSRTGLTGFHTSDGLNLTFEGKRLDLSVHDIIAIEGERVPSSKDAPKRFKMAFIVVGREGAPPSKASIDKVNTIRKGWGPYFRKASGNGTVTTNLVERN